MNVERQFEELLPLIERVVASINRRYALSEEEAEEFASWLKLRFIESDYAPLRKFRGQSRLQTYLVVVVKNLFQDYRASKWGKWRASATAKRAGEVGVQLESLLYRDRRTLPEAIAILRGNFGVQQSPAELERLAAELRPRIPRRFESEQRLESVPSAEPTPDDDADGRARRSAVKELEETLRSVLEALPLEDRAILELRFHEGLKIIDIARALGLDRRGVYGRMERLLGRLRQRLEEEGFAAERVVELLRWSDLDLDLALEDLRPPESPPDDDSSTRNSEVLRNVRLST